MYMYIHIYIYIYIHIHLHIYTFVISAIVVTTAAHHHEDIITVGFHNFNLRIFNLRVSNPNKLIVDVFLTRCRISMCQGLGRSHVLRMESYDCNNN